MSTDTKLALIVGALAAVGIGIAVLTYFYWRHTRPQRYMHALDALADVEQRVPRSPDDVPTAEQPTISASGATGAAAGAAGATTAVRILERDDADGDHSTSSADAEADPTSRVADGADADSDGIGHALDEPTTITTIEDLQSDASTGGDSTG
jgi:hypothetical protein